MGSRPLASLYSMIATYAVVVVLAVQLGAGATVLSDVENIFRGRAIEIVPDGSLASMFCHLFVAVALALAGAVVAGKLVEVLLGDSGDHAVEDELLPKQDGHLFKAFFFVMMLEELFARVLFLGLLRKIPGLDGTFGLYAMFLLGNGIWALIHLSNFKEESRRHPLRTLPQFVAGILFGYMYLKFGFLGALLTHTAYNAVLFASAKAQRTNIVDALIIAYSAIVAYFAFSCMERPLTDALQLIARESSLTIEGWAFWDYVKFDIFATFVMTAFAGVLLLDQTGSGSSESKSSNGSGDTPLLASLIALAVLSFGIVAMAVLLIYFLSWLLGFVVADLATRALVLSILFCFTHKSRSGSAIARTVLISIPSGFIGISVLYALGFWAAVGCCFVVAAVSIPLMVLNALDD